MTIHCIALMMHYMTSQAPTLLAAVANVEVNIEEMSILSSKHKGNPEQGFEEDRKAHYTNARAIGQLQ